MKGKERGFFPLTIPTKLSLLRQYPATHRSRVRPLPRLEVGPTLTSSDYVPYCLWQEAEPHLSSILQASRSSFKHELLLENLQAIPVMQQHGSDDENVPAYHSRLMHGLMEFTGWPSLYHELPGMGHWFDGVMTTSTLLEFYREVIRGWRRPSVPLEFSIVIPNSGDMGSKFGIFVDQLQSPDRYGHLKVKRSPEHGTWHLKTDNIRRFHLSLDVMGVNVPGALILDHEWDPFPVHPAESNSTWYLKDSLGRWVASNEVGWRQIHQRYGRQLGAMDAILRSSRPFSIRTCSSGGSHVASQISRNIFQYFAADSEIGHSCDDPTEVNGGNLITIAMGDGMPPSQYNAFPIFADRGRLQLVQASMSHITRSVSGADGHEDRSRYPYHYEYDYEPGMGAIFLRPLDHGRLELMVWGVDDAGLEHAARLVPLLTGVGQPDFVVLSARCRWMGHAGLSAAGFFDSSWQISAGAYIRASPRV
jgi:hypothetical protein